MATERRMMMKIARANYTLYYSLVLERRRVCAEASAYNKTVCIFKRVERGVTAHF